MSAIAADQVTPVIPGAELLQDSAHPAPAGAAGEAPADERSSPFLLQPSSAPPGAAAALQAPAERDASTLSGGEASNASEQGGDAPAQGEGTKKTRRKSQLLWAAAGAKVQASLQLTESFATLRDRSDLVINADDLEIKACIGEGAFGTVERATWRPPATQGLSTRSQESLAQTSQPQLLHQGSHGSQGKQVAVKRLKKEVVNEADDVLEMFMNECALNRKLKHKYIVEYVGLGCDDPARGKDAKESMFLVQEFMGGGTLKQLVMKQMQATKKIYTLAEALRWVTQVASALAYLHRCIPIVIHRDLKLENILLSEDKQTAKLADFGLVAFTRRQHKQQAVAATRAQSVEDAASIPGVTAALTIKTPKDGAKRDAEYARAMSRLLSHSFKHKPVLPSSDLKISDQMSARTGTFMYMAPEMFRGDKYDEKVDVFSFAIIMYELFSRYLTIYAISNAGTEAEIEVYASRIASGYRPPLKEGWHPELRAIISDCWAQDPAARPAMAEVHERLEALAKAGGLTEEPPSSGCECAIS